MSILNLKTSVFLLLVSLLLGCFSKEEIRKSMNEANSVFGDQHFKTAISLIELHKLRVGEYPIELNRIKYLGTFDSAIFGYVKYKKLDEGYQLDLLNSYMGRPVDLKYPEDFWKGLGIKKSNLKK